MTKGSQKPDKRKRYGGNAKNLRFNANLSWDRHVVALANFVGKKIGVSPQTTAREAMNLGLVELARIANVDLSKVILTADSGQAKEHGGELYPPENKSQEKLVS